MANPHPKPRTGIPNKPELRLRKNYTHNWLLKLGQDGFNAIADKNPIDIIKIDASTEDKKVDLVVKSLIEIDE